MNNVYVSVGNGERAFVSRVIRVIYVSICELSVKCMSCNLCE